jgi:hypothetical protein
MPWIRRPRPVKVGILLYLPNKHCLVTWEIDVAVEESESVHVQKARTQQRRPPRDYQLISFIINPRMVGHICIHVVICIAEYPRSAIRKSAVSAG